MSSYPSWFTDHVHIVATLNRVLNTINGRSRVHMRDTFVTLTRRKSLWYTALVLEHSIRILLRVQRMSINPPMCTQASLDNARLGMVHLLENMRADHNFPRTCLEIDSAYGVPTFLVRGLLICDFEVHEVRAIIFCVVGLLDRHGESISPSFVSDALLQRVRRIL
jgi:hypothetical protein